jgi:hypothetical protein
MAWCGRYQKWPIIVRSLGLVQNKTSKSLECLQQWNCVIEQVIHKLQYVGIETLVIHDRAQYVIEEYKSKHPTTLYTEEDYQNDPLRY